ncbi:hypothetical protein IV203_019799 [Nitzschia inconspicua]|uniref:Uncharacterized protein n=1 Tax=Nitzschia inconspicua TaxID=303405 RepID=A0A9K3LZZ1_9STRA|nr:hypothetical protein IV203_019799 [Nitzschia inconspicua]
MLRGEITNEKSEEPPLQQQRHPVHENSNSHLRAVVPFCNGAKHLNKLMVFAHILYLSTYPLAKKSVGMVEIIESSDRCSNCPTSRKPKQKGEQPFVSGESPQSNVGVPERLISWDKPCLDSRGHRLPPHFAEIARMAEDNHLATLLDTLVQITGIGE